MRILIDNCVPKKFAKLILGHEVVLARQRGWHELSNGRLLSAAEADGFEVFVTTDKNLQFQQNLRDRKITVILLAPRMMFIEHLVPLTGRLLGELADSAPGRFVVIKPEE